MNSERISPFWVNGYQPFSADIDFGDMAWEAGIYYINRKRNRVLKCYLNKEKYKYTPGKYRVIKYITIEKEIYEKRKVVADFILK